MDDSYYYIEADFTPDQYAPPKKPVLCRCTVCRQFFMSNEMFLQDGKWMCRFAPKCDGHGFGLNVFERTHGIFSKIGTSGVYRQRGCPPAGR